MSKWADTIEHKYRRKDEFHGLNVDNAAEALQELGYVRETPLQYSNFLSDLLECNVYLKREDQQPNGSFKLRGAAYHIMNSTAEAFVCASAGNHAQGVALACAHFRKKAIIYMPEGTPETKWRATQEFGGEFVEIRFHGKTFDEAKAAAIACQQETGAEFVHPFDSPYTILGQGTIAKEIYKQLQDVPVDYIMVAVGGGGLSAGVAKYIKDQGLTTKVIGVEPKEAASMVWALTTGSDMALKKMRTTVDGAAVANVGVLTSKVLLTNNVRMETVSEPQVFYALKQLHEHGIQAELAGALPLAALHAIKDELRGKTVVLVIGGKNIDRARLDDIIENKAPDEFPVDTKPLRYDPQKRVYATRSYTSNFPGMENDAVLAR